MIESSLSTDVIRLLPLSTETDVQEKTTWLRRPHKELSTQTLMFHVKQPREASHGRVSRETRAPGPKSTTNVRQLEAANKRELVSISRPEAERAHIFIWPASLAGCAGRFGDDHDTGR
jgi:hypothetical protein